MQSAKCKMQNRDDAPALFHASIKMFAIDHFAFCILHFALPSVFALSFQSSPTSDPQFFRETSAT